MISIYSTKDIGLATALISAGKKISKTNREDNTYWFIFEDLASCLVLEKEYWFGELLVNAKTYKQNLDQLKNIVHS